MFTNWTPIIHFYTTGILSGLLLDVHNKDKQSLELVRGKEYMKPNAVTLLPGGDAIKSVYERMLSGKNGDFVCLSTGYTQVVGEWYDNDFSPRLFKSGVMTREIVADTTGNREYGKDKDGEKNQVRYLTESAESDLVLGDDFAAIISFNPENPYAVVIEDEAIVKSAKVWFETMWQSAAR